MERVTLDGRQCEQLVGRLLALPDEIAAQECVLLESETRVSERREDLQDREAALLLATDSPIDGKNAEMQSAQLRQLTARERIAHQRRWRHRGRREAAGEDGSCRCPGADEGVFVARRAARPQPSPILFEHGKN